MDRRPPVIEFDVGEIVMPGFLKYIIFLNMLGVLSGIYNPW